MPRAAQPATVGASISLDDAGPAGRFEAAAQSRRLFRQGKGTDKGTIKGALIAEIGAANDRRPAAELIGVFRLERPERSLSLALAALGCDLNGIAVAARGRRRRSRHGAGARHSHRRACRWPCSYPRSLGRWRTALATGNDG